MVIAIKYPYALTFHILFLDKVKRKPEKVLCPMFIFRRLTRNYDKNYMDYPPSRIVFSYGNIKDISPDDLIKTLWVSTAMALVLVLPPLAIFVGIIHSTEDILSASLIGFGVHFAILAFSVRICTQLEKLFTE
jgi:hypothetical protein